MRNKKQAFTLVELIVVITILAILGTIGFLSFQGYSKSSRDSVRVQDIKSIEQSLELFTLKTGNYPAPSNSYNVTYSGALVWNFGTVGDSVHMKLDKLNKLPIDPLTSTQYAYSRLNTGKEYQIGAILEGDSIAKNLIVDTIYAATQTATAYVTGKYNGSIAKVSTGGLDYVLAVPTILTSEVGDADLVDIMNNQSLVFNGYSNVPGVYQDYSGTGGFSFQPTPLVVYQGNINDLTNAVEQETFSVNLQKSYSGTVLENHTNYDFIMKMNPNHIQEANNVIASLTTNMQAGLPDLKLSQKKVVKCEDMSQGDLDDLNAMAARFNSWNGGMVRFNDWTNEFPQCDAGSCVLTKEEWCNADALEFRPDGPETVSILPEGAKYLTKMKYINSYGPVFGAGVLPNTIYDMHNLEYLFIGGMSGSNTIPSQIKDLGKLNSFSIYETQLTNISPELWKKTNLTYLGLNDTQISSLPSEISNFKNLTQLYLENNQFTTLPSGILSLNNLGRLVMGNNQFTSIPSGLGALTNMYYLNLQDNALTSIPDDFDQLTNVSSIFISGNPGLGNLNSNSWNPAKSQANITPSGKTVTIDKTSSPIVITVSP